MLTFKIRRRYLFIISTIFGTLFVITLAFSIKAYIVNSKQVRQSLIVAKKISASLELKALVQDEESELLKMYIDQSCSTQRLVNLQQIQRSMESQLSFLDSTTKRVQGVSNLTQVHEDYSKHRSKYNELINLCCNNPKEFRNTLNVHKKEMSSLEHSITVLADYYKSRIDLRLTEALDYSTMIRKTLLVLALCFIILNVVILVMLIRPINKTLRSVQNNDIEKK